MYVYTPILNSKTFKCENSLPPRQRTACELVLMGTFNAQLWSTMQIDKLRQKGLPSYETNYKICRVKLF